MQLEALEVADECLALIEDVVHGAMSDNVTSARGIVLTAIKTSKNPLRYRSTSEVVS